MGVDIITGFAADKLLYEGDKVTGLLTKDFGVLKNGEKSENYESGVRINSKVLVLAEGARGYLSEKVIEKYDLRKNAQPQIYGLGIKEVWEVPEG